MIKFIDVWKAFRMNKNGGLFVTLIQVMARATPFQVFEYAPKIEAIFNMEMILLMFLGTDCKS